MEKGWKIFFAVSIPLFIIGSIWRSVREIQPIPLQGKIFEQDLKEDWELIITSEDTYEISIASSDPFLLESEDSYISGDPIKPPLGYDDDIYYYYSNDFNGRAEWLIRDGNGADMEISAKTPIDGVVQPTRSAKTQTFVVNFFLAVLLYLPTLLFAILISELLGM
ncbi:MAG: hypothetical protein WCY37_02665 [Candidatus Dojkabacteria bacterium]